MERIIYAIQYLTEKTEEGINTLKEGLENGELKFEDQIIAEIKESRLLIKEAHEAIKILKAAQKPIANDKPGN